MSDKVRRRRLWLEMTLALFTGLLTVVTVVAHDWLELFGIDPDRGDGSLEVLATVALAALTLVLIGAARVDWRRDSSRRSEG